MARFELRNPPRGERAIPVPIARGCCSLSFSLCFSSVAPSSALVSRDPSRSPSTTIGVPVALPRFTSQLPLAHHGFPMQMHTLFPFSFSLSLSHCSFPYSNIMVLSFSVGLSIPFFLLQIHPRIVSPRLSFSFLSLSNSNLVSSHSLTSLTLSLILARSLSGSLPSCRVTQPADGGLSLPQESTNAGGTLDEFLNHFYHVNALCAKHSRTRHSSTRVLRTVFRRRLMYVLCFVSRQGTLACVSSRKLRNKDYIEIRPFVVGGRIYRLLL